MPSSPSVRTDIIPADEADCLLLAQIESLAFSYCSEGQEASNLSRIMFGDPSAEREDIRAAELLKKMQTDSTAKIYKAVVNNDIAESRKIVGWAIWHYYLDPRPVEEWEDSTWSLCRSPDACNEFFGSLTRARNYHMSGRRYGLLSVLAILPEYQGQGIGSALLKSGLIDGRAKGLAEFWLESSAEGYRLYRKFGFEDVGVINIDMAKYGGVGFSKHVCMKKLVGNSLFD